MGEYGGCGGKDASKLAPLGCLMLDEMLSQEVREVWEGGEGGGVRTRPHDHPKPSG